MARTTIIQVKVEFTPDAGKLFKGKTITVNKVGKISLEAMIPFNPDSLEDFARAQKEVSDFRAEITAMATGTPEMASRVTSTADEVPAFTVGDDDSGEQ